MAKLHRQIAAAFMLCLGVLILGISLATDEPAQGRVVALRVDGAIGPASADFIVQGLARAAQSGAGLVVLEMDTPGGLDTSMRVIIKAILASPVPVATYVSPEGARAASAGTFILYASHIAAMAPATNLGAASPVSIGAPGGGGSPPARTPDKADEEETDTSAANSDEDKKAQRGSGRSSGDTMKDKVTNDAAAYIRGLAQLRERNGDFAERAVREAASLSASEALEAGVIDVVAATLEDLLVHIDKREIRLDSGNTVTLSTAGADVERVLPDWRNQLLSIIANPQIALVLMMIGIYGLFFEFTSPGFGVPGVAGMICILIAMYAFQLLPVNWAGVALIGIGAILMLAEAFAPSFGVLGIGGIVAFIVGGLFLMDGEVPGFDISLPFLIAMALFSAGLLFAIGTLAVKARKRRVVSGREDLLGAMGTIMFTGTDAHYARIHGESWRVASDQPLELDARVRVIAIDGLTLRVEPLAQEAPTTERST